MEKKNYMAPAMRVVQMRHKCIMGPGSPGQEPIRSVSGRRNSYHSVDAATWE